MKSASLMMGVILLAGCSGSGSGGDEPGGAGSIRITALSLRGALDVPASVDADGRSDLDPDPRAYRHDLVLGQGGIGPDPMPGGVALELMVPVTANAAGQVSTRVLNITMDP